MMAQRKHQGRAFLADGWQFGSALDAKFAQAPHGGAAILVAEPAAIDFVAPVAVEIEVNAYKAGDGSGCADEVAVVGLQALLHAPPAPAIS